MGGSTHQPLGTQPEFDVWGVAEVSDNAQAAEGEVKHLQAEEGQNVARAILKRQFIDVMKI